jgi:predicted regulator of Ras-like GTPase activity (Roadblock/LC7/MglB family)
VTPVETPPAPSAFEAAASEPAPRPEPATAAAEPAEPPIVTETLADLYRDQGYVDDARAAYATLASAEPDLERRRELTEKADGAAQGRPATREARLRAFLTRVPAAAGSPDMTKLLQDLVARTDGVLSAALTDLEGLPVLSAGDAESSELEALIAELTAFWKGVGRIDGDVGTGPLNTLTLSARHGGAVVSSVSGEYALILKVAPGAPMGRIRYEAARAAWLLAPALR